ncbi:MAG: hemerythrin domain-containing protein [Magnetococcus sp. DMHC-8]
MYGPETRPAPFLWSEELRTGHDAIDRQHQDLYASFRGVSQLLEVPEVNVKYWFGMVMRNTEEYVLTHFADEEQLMAERHYPDHHLHKGLHVEIVATLHKHQAVIKQLTTAAEQIAEARSLLDFLNDWLNTHVMVDDKNFVEFMNRESVHRPSAV